MRLRPLGRGKNYGSLRGALEASLRLLYRGDWPARLWGAVPGACDVALVAHELPILLPDLVSLRVGFISDIHVGPTTPEGLLDAAFAHLATARLDVLLLGGDYVYLDVDEAKMSALASRIRDVPATRKIAVLGNHDLWTRHDVIEAALDRAGVELLVNRSTALASHPGVRIVGLDEPWTGEPDGALAFQDAGASDTLIVLCHSPDGLPHAQRAMENLPAARALFVCGHTHGGHLASPWGPLVVPGRMGWRYPSGLHDLGSTKLYVSRGVGGVELPMRTYAPPEIVVFDVTCARRDA
jgi:predicted MPP superfamily phosphohydrolase